MINSYNLHKLPDNRISYLVDVVYIEHAKLPEVKVDAGITIDMEVSKLPNTK